MKFLDLFAGIGGFRLGFEQANHTCVGWVEWDDHARKSYEAIHNTSGEWTRHDITQVTNAEWRELRGKVDVITGGFPCQAFSVGGARLGFYDTRGTMFFELARAVQQIEPRFVVLENVKGLLSHAKGQTFATIINQMDELGYDCEWEVCNSQSFGVPQNRERVYIIASLRGTGGRKVFPIHGTDGKINSQIVKAHEVRAISTINRAYKVQNGRRVKDDDEPMFTLTTKDVHGVAVREATKKGYAIAHEGDSINLTAMASTTRRGRVGKAVANTLDTECKQGVLEGYRIRRLTPLECFRLQGFPDWTHERASQVCSMTQLYKQIGNSVTVPLVYEIAKRLEG